MKIDESTLEVQLQRRGKTLTNVTSWEIDSHYMVSTDAFRFTIYSEKPETIDDFELEPVRLSVAGAPQLVGRIDASTIGDQGSAITYEGRDYLADFVEDNVDMKLTFKEGATLKGVALAVLAPHGVNDVVSESDYPVRQVRTGKKIGGPPCEDYKALQVEDLKPDSGMGSYDFLNRLVVRFHATIQPTLDRQKILITGPNYKQTPIYSLTRYKDRGGSNNIVTARRNRNFGSVPSFVQFVGSQSKAGTDGTALYRTISAAATARALNMQFAGVLTRGQYESQWKKDSEYQYGKSYRLLAHKDDESKTTSQLEAAAFRSLYERMKECLVYTCTVQGHISPDTGAVWSIDTMVQVHDEVCRVFGPMWIVGRTLRFDMDQGATTELTMWAPGMFKP